PQKCLPPQPGPPRLVEPCRLLGLAAAGLRGRAGGTVTVAATDRAGQRGVGCERFDKEAHGADVQPLVMAQLGQLEALGGALGPPSALEDRWQVALQLQEAFAPLDPPRRVVVPVLPPGPQGVALLEFRQGSAELPLTDEGVAEVAVRLG